MPSSTERDIILEHALRNQENLETALDIVFSFPGLQEQIIVGFLNKLEKFVLDELGDPDGSKWKVNNGSLRDSPLGKGKVFSFGNKSWGDQYGVALAPEKGNVREVAIGAYGRTTKPRVGRLKETLDAILKALDATIKLRETDEDENGLLHWRYSYPDAPYRDWNTKDALIKLYNGKAVEDLGPDLVQIINVAAPIIDKHVRRSS